LLGVVGVGTYHLDRVAQSLSFPFKTIAVETDKDRLRSSHAEHALLIGDHGSTPATVRAAQLMARDRKSDISQLLSGLDLAFILTGLNGIAGKGVTSVIAGALGEMGVFTIAVLPGRREVEAVRSLQHLVDVLFEVPYEPLMKEAGTQRFRLTEFVSAAVAQICRAVTLSLVHSRSVETDSSLPDLIGRRITYAQTPIERTTRIPANDPVDALWHLIVSRLRLLARTSAPQGHSIRLEHQPVAEQRQRVGLFVDHDTISLCGRRGCYPRRPPHDSNPKPKRAAYGQRNHSTLLQFKACHSDTLLLLSLARWTRNVSTLSEVLRSGDVCWVEEFSAEQFG
jgi:hypothetical protein